jgi:hypothetical protein
VVYSLEALIEAAAAPNSVKEFGLGAVWTWGDDNVA